MLDPLRRHDLGRFALTTAAAAIAVLVAAGLLGRSDGATAVDPTPTASTDPTRTVLDFQPVGEVGQDGERVIALDLDLGPWGGAAVDGLTAADFRVRATAWMPQGAEQSRPEVYSGAVTVSGVVVTEDGDVRLLLHHGEDTDDGVTIAWSSSAMRNVSLDLRYDLTVLNPLPLRDGGELAVEAAVQGDLVNPEVDAFDEGETEGLRYRLWRPDFADTASTGRPLLVWLPANGDGGAGEIYDGDSHLRAVRGALALAGAEAQELFGGAYVLAPQVEDSWFEDEDQGYVDRLLTLIDQVCEQERIDRSRVHLTGASSGGMMAVKVAAARPEQVASVVLSAPALHLYDRDWVTEEQVLRLSEVPTWFVAAREDDVVDYSRSTEWAHGLLPDSIATVYDRVTWQGEDYPPHYAWIYTANNTPTTEDGRSLWAWMAEQRSAEDWA